MNIIVQKYGGTSLGSIERINNVASRIKKWASANYKLVIVVSAMSGKTNELNDLAHQIDELPNKKSLDFILILRTSFCRTFINFIKQTWF